MSEFRSSPSGIDTAKLCIARAVAHYVWGYNEPENERMREGTRLHRVMQAYLRDGVVPGVEEKAARKMLEVLPVGAASIHAADIERVVLLDQHHGYMDWAQPERAVIGDLKFTGDVKWQRQKDPTKDPQRIMYAVDFFTTDTSLRVLKQHWSVSQFDGTKALTLSHEWVRADAFKAYDEVVRPLHDVLADAAAKKLHWQDAPKNHESCDVYRPNGCMMKQHGCRRGLAQRLLAITPKKGKTNG